MEQVCQALIRKWTLSLSVFQFGLSFFAHLTLGMLRFFELKDGIKKNSKIIKANAQSRQAGNKKRSQTQKTKGQTCLGASKRHKAAPAALIQNPHGQGLHCGSWGLFLKEKINEVDGHHFAAVSIVPDALTYLAVKYGSWITFCKEE